MEEEEVWKKGNSNTPKYFENVWQRKFIIKFLREDCITLKARRQMAQENLAIRAKPNVDSATAAVSAAAG